MHSKKIELKTLRNTRDLGGIVNKDGLKIKSKRLYRSGELSRISPEDANALYDDYNLRTIVDLRNQQEMVERPDIVIKDQRYVANTIIPISKAGGTHDEEATKRKEELARKADIIAHFAKKGMEMFYMEMFEDYGTKNFGNFLREVLNSEAGILWHCAIGKDRVGVSTAILLRILNVDDETIMNDYLYTNHCFNPGYKPQDTVRDWCDYAHSDYLITAFKEIDFRFGSFENFLISGCNFSLEDQEKLREKYLEK